MVVEYWICKKVAKEECLHSVGGGVGGVGVGVGVGMGVNGWE